MYPPASRPENNLGMVIKQRQRNHVLVRVSKIYFEWNQCKFLFEAVVNRHRNGHNICEMASLTVLRERSLDMHSNQLTRLVKRLWCTRYSSTCNTKKTRNSSCWGECSWTMKSELPVIVTLAPPKDPNSQLVSTGSSVGPNS